MIYRLYPRIKVFIDGRSDFYGPKFVASYLDVVQIHSNWSGRLDEYGIDTILAPVDGPLALSDLAKLKFTGWWIVARPARHLPGRLDGSQRRNLRADFDTLNWPTLIYRIGTSKGCPQPAFGLSFEA